ncbi:MAG: pyridoxamine 5'-phosphate oxidase family protein [Flavobacteriales bacterium]
MGSKYQEIPKKQIDFINKQHMFFVATAGDTGTVNLSPKGMDSFRVLNNKRIVWMNLTGSGNETAAHLLINNRMTIMFCSFEKQPLILRLYGKAKIYHPRDDQFEEYTAMFRNTSGVRQFIEMDVELVQTSCGYGVPFMNYEGERETLQKWSDNKSEDQIIAYWKEKNAKSIDGFDTKMNVE